MKTIKNEKVIKLTRNKELLFFSIIFLLTAIAWIVVEIHHIEKNKKFAIEYQKGMTMEIKKLPSLDVINKLEQRL